MNPTPTLLPRAARGLAIAAVLLAFAGCAADGKQQSAGTVLDDSVITTKVKSAFVTDDKVSALDIGVQTNNGNVQLSGFAKSSEEAQKAVQIARGVSGVKSVRNDIVVK